MTEIFAVCIWLNVEKMSNLTIVWKGKADHWKQSSTATGRVAGDDYYVHSCGRNHSWVHENPNH